uniref:Endonuclease/exonuclease/phosphatase domain-containing protein n=1 Tax=Quercus lobata TaxID=97700 RepID=A0A7N2RCH8_QUELO
MELLWPTERGDCKGRLPTPAKIILDKCEDHAVDFIDGFSVNGGGAVLEASNATRGACKPSFQKHVGEMVRNHNSAMLVVMETGVGGSRAKEISDRLSFDGSVHIDTIGYTNGLWLLWHSDRVDVTPLAHTEQEIHAIVKVQNSNSSWLFTAVYASPRTAERFILWNNLIKTAELHDMLWVSAGDFNEPLMEEDKSGGRAVSVNRSLFFKECLDKCNVIDIGFSGP